MTTQKQTIRKPEVLAQHTPAPGSDMKWLQQLLRAEDGQLSLGVQLELEYDNIPL